MRLGSVSSGLSTALYRERLIDERLVHGALFDLHLDFGLVPRVDFDRAVEGVEINLGQADSPSVLRLTSHPARNVDARTNAPATGSERWTVSLMSTSGR